MMIWPGEAGFSILEHTVPVQSQYQICGPKCPSLLQNYLALGGGDDEGGGA